jgi:hypothetical protein
MSIKTCHGTIKKHFDAHIFTTEQLLSCSFPRWLHVKSVAYGDAVFTGAFGKSPLILR